MPAIWKEFHGSGLFNQAALKYCAWFFALYAGLTVGYTMNHANAVEALVDEYEDVRLAEDSEIIKKLDSILLRVNASHTEIQVIKTEITYLKGDT